MIATAKKEETHREEETGEFRLSETPAARVCRSPWEYVFDGSEDDNGTYFWVLKPEAVRAYREIIDADIGHLEDIRSLLMGARGASFPARLRIRSMRSESGF